MRNESMFSHLSRGCNSQIPNAKQIADLYKISQEGMGGSNQGLRLINGKFADPELLNYVFSDDEYTSFAHEWVGRHKLSTELAREDRIIYLLTEYSDRAIDMLLGKYEPETSKEEDILLETLGHIPRAYLYSIHSGSNVFEVEIDLDEELGNDPYYQMALRYDEKIGYSFLTGEYAIDPEGLREFERSQLGSSGDSEQEELYLDNDDSPIDCMQGMHNEVHLEYRKLGNFQISCRIPFRAKYYYTEDKKDLKISKEVMRRRVRNRKGKRTSKQIGSKPRRGGVRGFEISLNVREIIDTPFEEALELKEAHQRHLKQSYARLGITDYE